MDHMEIKKVLLHLHVAFLFQFISLVVTKIQRKKGGPEYSLLFGNPEISFIDVLLSLGQYFSFHFSSGI